MRTVPARTRMSLAALALCGLVVVAASRLLAGPATTSLSGVVRDPAGKPVPAVWIAREGFRDSSGGTPWWRSDAEGRFRIDGLPAGEVVLRIVPGEASLLRGFLVKAAAGRDDVDIVVEPGNQALLQIADYQAPKGEPRHARLTWGEPDGRRPVRYCPIAPDGRVRFVDLPAGVAFELWALAGPGRPVHATGLGASEREVVVKATPGLTIAGNVLPPTGQAASHVSVWVEASPGFDVGRVTPAVDGSFVVADLPDGTYTVKAGIVHGAVTIPVKAVVKAGTTDVVLDLRR